MSTKAKIIISIIFGISFILGAFAIGHSYYQAKKPLQTVSVVGLAEKDFVSDLIVYDFNYSVKNMEMKTAYVELKRQTEIVKKYLKEKGINDAEITFKSVTNREDNEYNYDRSAERSYYVFTGYVLTQTVRIESKDVEKIENLHLNIADLLDQGVTIQANEPNYYYTQLSDLKIEMLDEATEDARHRAETIATSSGSKLGKLKVANMGVFQITAPNSSDEDYTWGGAFNTSSKNKRASINMRLTYYVK